jgi:hypothetical protein
MARKHTPTATGAPAAGTPEDILAGWKAQRRQEEERQVAASERLPWLLRLAGHKKTFCDALPGYHQTRLPPGDIIGAGRHESVANAFLSFVSALHGETHRNENACDRLRRSLPGDGSSSPHARVARRLYELAEAGNRTALIERIRELGEKAPPLEQQAVYTSAKYIAEGVVSDHDLLVCRMALGAGQATTQPPPTPEAPAHREQVGTSGGRKPAPKKKRGRKQDSNPAADSRLCEDWKAAKRQSMTRRAFCRERGIKLSDLIAAQDRVKYRRNRDAE